MFTDRFEAFDQDYKGRVIVTWTEGVVGDIPNMATVNAFRSNVNDDAFFIGVSDALVEPSPDGDRRERNESTFYVDAQQAATLAKAFAHIAAKLSDCAHAGQIIQTLPPLG